MENQDRAYKASLNPNCSIFTAEATAISVALGNMIDAKEDKDLLILSHRVCARN